jgi:Zn-dependent peptidase ImmA (M78 family)/transcriptional regulator with XRE-family HTH domain
MPFNPEMLILARESQGFTQTDLSTLISVKQGTISKIENGMLPPSPELMREISEKLHYHEEFFYQLDRVYGFNSTVFFHRKRQSLADKVLRKLHAQMNLTRIRVSRLLRSMKVASPFSFRPIEPTEYAGGVSAAARMMRAAWQLPSGPIRSVTQAIEDAGGIVVPLDFGTRQADAVSEWISGFPPIFLVNSNSDIPGDRLRLTLAHEMAHVVMHRFPTAEMEIEANEFAAEFLMPRREIKASLYGLTMAKLADLKRFWRVSMAALIMRAYELKTITDSQRRYLFINVSKRSGGRLHEPLESEIPPEQPQLFQRLIRTHVEELGYSVPELLRLLFISDEQQFRNQYLGEKRLRLV